jgi:hypothetical protein
MTCPHDWDDPWDPCPDCAGEFVRGAIKYQDREKPECSCIARLAEAERLILRGATEDSSVELRYAFAEYLEKYNVERVTCTNSKSK